MVEYRCCDDFRANETIFKESRRSNLVNISTTLIFKLMWVALREELILDRSCGEIGC